MSGYDISPIQRRVAMSNRLALSVLGPTFSEMIKTLRAQKAENVGKCPDDWILHPIEFIIIPAGTTYRGKIRLPIGIKEVAWMHDSFHWFKGKLLGDTTEQKHVYLEYDLRNEEGVFTTFNPLFEPRETTHTWIEKLSRLDPDKPRKQVGSFRRRGRNASRPRISVQGTGP